MLFCFELNLFQLEAYSFVLLSTPSFILSLGPSLICSPPTSSPLLLALMRSNVCWRVQASRRWNRLGSWRARPSAGIPIVGICWYSLPSWRLSCTRPSYLATTSLSSRYKLHWERGGFWQEQPSPLRLWKSVEPHQSSLIFMTSFW